jgi:tetratricopeptide (TPR) repeat protein
VWVAWRDVDGPAALGRVRRAHAAAHRQTRLILVHPAMAVPDFWPVHDRYAELGAACAVLQKAGAASPGRLAALAGLEPEAVGLLAERVRGGQAREGLEQKLLEQKDPGAWLTEGTASSVFPSPPEWRAGRRPQVLVADEARPVDQPMRLHATTWPIEREGSDLAEGDAFSRSRARDANEAALRHAVVEAGARGDRQGEAAARLALGRALRRRYAGLEAESTLRAAVGAYAAVSDRAGESEARGELGHILLLMGRTREAEAMVHDALSLAESTEGPRGRQVARLRTMLGDVYSRTDRHKEGAQSYEQALSLYRAVGDQRGEADVLASQGELYVRMGRLEDAERNYDMALLLYRALDKRRGEATMLMALGDLYARANRAEEAAHNYDLALSLYRLIDDRLGEANVLLALGELHMHTNHLDNANYNYNQALLLYRAIDDRLGEANALLALGDVCMHLGRLKDAERYYDQALPLYRAIDDRLGEANALASIGDLVLSSGHPYEAFSYYLASMRRHEEIGNVLGIASSRANLARASLVGKCPMRAVALLRASIAFYEGHEDHSDLVSAYRDLAIALSELGWEEAAGAALLLAWVHAAIVGHPFALLMVAKAQSAAPSSPEDVERAKAMVADAIATCERELEARGEDPYAPLTPNAMAS